MTAPSKHVVGEWVRTCALKPGEKLVLMLVYDRANAGDDGRWSSFAGCSTLAKESGYTVDGVRNILARLDRLGVITREHRRRRNGSRTSNLIVLNVGSNAASESPDAVATELPDSVDKRIPGCVTSESPDADQKHQKKPQPILQESVSHCSSTTPRKRDRKAAAALQLVEGKGWSSDVRADEDIWAGSETDTQDSEKEKDAA